MLRAHQQYFPAGSWIFREGDDGDCAYLVEEGEVLILLERGDQHISLGVYGKGSMFGEMAIIDDQPRSASAFTSTSCTLRTISRSQLNYRIEKADPVLQVCISVLLGHLRKTLTHFNQSSSINQLVHEQEPVHNQTDHELKSHPHTDQPPSPIIEQALHTLHLELP